MTVANPRRYTLADAIRDEFARQHPCGKNTLLCVGLCRRRKDREDFRETPWHGRAASCKSCEGEGWRYEREERTYWELAQARQTLYAYQRYARVLQLRLLLKSMPTSADTVRAHREPFERAVEHKTHMWASVIAEAVREAGRDA
jgi:hypothetical protein